MKNKQKKFKNYLHHIQDPIQHGESNLKILKEEKNYKTKHDTSLFDFKPIENIRSKTNEANTSDARYYPIYLPAGRAKS